MSYKFLCALGVCILGISTYSYTQTTPADTVDALSALRQAAMKASSSATEPSEPSNKSFIEKSRSLQASNPQISLVSDALTILPGKNSSLEPGLQYRELGLHFESTLDPFSFAKAAIPVSPEGIELEEAYVTWTNPLPRTSLTFGKFRQKFGIINRWHTHALDQSYLPLPIQEYMGDDGLAGTGVSAHILLPSLIAQTNELTVQITNTDNAALFDGDQSHLPTLLLHLNNYYDLSPSTYFEWCVSSVTGANDSLGFNFSDNHRWTFLNGADFTLSWFPTSRSDYQNLTWRNEIFHLSKARADGKTVSALGAYSYVNYKFTRSMETGLRIDYAQDPDLSSNYQWQVVPYLKFIESEFVYLRLEAPSRHFSSGAPADNALTLQIVWAVGPHHHDKY